MFYPCLIVEKKVTKSKVDVTLKDKAEMFKDDIKTLKQHIYIKRRLVNAYNDIKASLSESDLILHVDFAERCTNDQEDPIQSAYFRNQCFDIFTECFYAESSDNNDVRNDNVIVDTESFEHDRVVSVSYLQKIVHNIKHMLEKTYKNVYVWSDGVRSQSRCRYIIKLLFNKGSMFEMGEW